MKDFFKKVSVTNFLLIIWAIFSFLYIGYNIWTNFKIGVMQQSYVAGQTDTINELIKQAENKECQPFNVHSGEKKLDLINVSCLQKTQTQQQVTPETPKK